MKTSHTNNIMQMHSNTASSSRYSILSNLRVLEQSEGIPRGSLSLLFFSLTLYSLSSLRDVSNYQSNPLSQKGITHYKDRRSI